MRRFSWPYVVVTQISTKKSFRINRTKRFRVAHFLDTLYIYQQMIALLITLIFWHFSKIFGQKRLFISYNKWILTLAKLMMIKTQAQTEPVFQIDKLKKSWNLSYFLSRDKISRWETRIRFLLFLKSNLSFRSLAGMKLELKRLKKILFERLLLLLR